jgi:hypothetical protein
MTPPLGTLEYLIPVAAGVVLGLLMLLVVWLLVLRH